VKSVFGRIKIYYLGPQAAYVREKMSGFYVVGLRDDDVLNTCGCGVICHTSGQLWNWLKDRSAFTLRVFSFTVCACLKNKSWDRKISKKFVLIRRPLH